MSYYTSTERAMMAERLARYDADLRRYRRRERIARLAVLACAVVTVFVFFYGVTQ